MLDGLDLGGHGSGGGSGGKGPNNVNLPNKDYLRSYCQMTGMNF